MPDPPAAHKSTHGVLKEPAHGTAHRTHKQHTCWQGGACCVLWLEVIKRKRSFGLDDIGVDRIICWTKPTHSLAHSTHGTRFPCEMTEGFLLIMASSEPVVHS